MKMTEERKLTYPELGGLFHGVLFSYEKTLLDMYGKEMKDIFPYLLEELDKVIQNSNSGTPIVDPALSLEDNLRKIESFVSNEEFYKDIKFDKIGKDKYVVDIGECVFAKSGVHDILKLTDGSTCTMAIILTAMMASLLKSNEYIDIQKSEFLEKGTKTSIEIKKLADELTEGPALKNVKTDKKSEIEEGSLEVGGVSKPPLDSIDLKLVNLLRNHGRLNNVELAEKLDTSEATVRRRIQYLIDKGYIKGFSALLDYTKFAPKIRVYLSLSVEDQFREDLVSDLNKIPKICSLYRTLGDYNIMAEMLFDDMPSIQKFIDELSQYEHIKNINYHIATSSYKPCPWYGI
jgi:DNA-binding Lrp family transcriptional regulator